MAAVAFVTMGIGISTRTAFSLMFPPILDEFGWERGLTAGAFSVGFLVSALYSPFMGRLMDRHGPRVVLVSGVAMVAGGLGLAVYVREPWHLYATLGILVAGGSLALGYTGHGLFLANWFVRRRGLASGLAFAGVGVGAIIVLPWVQSLIARGGWRQACWSLAVLVVVVLLPLNLIFPRRRPEDLGLAPDGDLRATHGHVATPPANVVDHDWVAVEWTLARAMRTARFWWLFTSFSTALFSWYAVQVHQTKYLIDVGFTAERAAWALGLVGVAGIAGQVVLGHVSDRIGREWVWMIGCLGFAICYGALVLMGRVPSNALLWTMVIAQGFLGYALTSVIGAIPAEIFQGRHFGSILGTLMGLGVIGGAAGPWVTGLAYDLSGSYAVAFGLAIALCCFSALAIWLAGPRQIRAVAGRVLLTPQFGAKQ